MIPRINTKAICIVFGIVFLALYTLSFGQDVSVKGKVEKDTIRIADQTYLVYTFEKTDSIKLRIPDYTDSSLGDIDVIGKPSLDSSKLEGHKWNLELQMRITAFDTGQFYIPPQAFAYTNNLTTDSVYSDSIYLKVVGVTLDSTIRDIKSPYSFKTKAGPEKEKSFWEKLKEYLVYIIPALILLILLFLLYRYLKDKRPRTQLFHAKIEEEPAYITAFRELDRIKAQKLWQQKQYKEYYTRITHVVRWYIHKRFSVNALELTSDETLRLLKLQKLDDVNFYKLSELLNLADIVKFAKGEPDAEENMVHLENAYEFVQKTRTNAGDTADNDGSEDNK